MNDFDDDDFMEDRRACFLNTVSADGAVQLTWSPFSDAAGYIVYAGRSDGGAISPVMTCSGDARTSGEENACDAEVTDITNGVVYLFRVAGYILKDRARVIIDETPTVACVPYPPLSDFKAVPGNGCVVLSWSKFATRELKTLQEYQVIVTKDGVDTVHYTCENPVTIPYLENGGAYSVKIRPFSYWNGGEYYGNFSETAEFTPREDEFAVSPEYLFLRSGEKAKITFKGGTNPLWTTSSASVASVDFDGNVTANSEGVALVLVKGDLRFSNNNYTGATTTARRSKVFVSVDREPAAPFYPVPPERYVTLGDVMTERNCEAEITIVGDICCSSFSQLGAYRNGKYHWNDSFSYMNGILGDYSVGFLCATLSEKMPYAMEMPVINGAENINVPACFLDSMRFVGFDLLSLCAKNSAEEDVEATVNQLNKYKIATFKNNGGGICPKITADIKGIKVSFIQVGNRADYADDAAFTAVLDAVNGSGKDGGADYVIVMAEFGRAGSRIIRDEDRAFAAQLAGAGADYIIGRGTGFPGRFETLRIRGGRHVCVAYSLGKFYSAGQHYRNGMFLRLKLYKDCLKGTVELISNTYVPVRTFDIFHNIQNPVLPVLPHLMRDVDVPLFHSVREEIREITGGEIIEEGDEAGQSGRSFRVCGSNMLARSFEKMTDSSVDTELLYNSPLTIFSKPGTPASISNWNFATRSIHHNVTKDAFEYCKMSRSDFFVFDFYYAATTPMYELNGAFYTANSGFEDTDFFSRNRHEFKKLTPPFSESVYKPLIDIFVAGLLKIYDSTEIVLVRVTPMKYYAVRDRVRQVKNYNKALAEYILSLEEYFLQRVNCIIVDISKNFFGDGYTRDVKSGVNFDSYYFAQVREILQNIAFDNLQLNYVDIVDPQIWMRRLIYYYDSIKANNLFDEVLNYDHASDILARYTSKEFIKIYYDKFIEIRAAEYSTLDSVLENYCNAVSDENGRIVPQGLFAEGIAAVNVILKETMYGGLMENSDKELFNILPDMSVIFKYDFLVLDELIPFVAEKLTEFNLNNSGNEVIITRDNLEFNFKALKYYFTTTDLMSTAEAVRANARVNAAIVVDVWGSDVSSLSLTYNCRKLYPENVLVNCPFVFAFDPPANVDPARVENSPDFKGAVEQTSVTINLFKGAVDMFMAGRGEWLIVDFASLVQPVVKYPALSGYTYFGLSEFLANSDLFRQLRDSGAVVLSLNDIVAEHGNEIIDSALREFIDFAVSKYGHNIIMNKVKVKYGYITVDGDPCDFRNSEKLVKLAKIIERAETEFSNQTDCYVIDLADYFPADDKFPVGGATPTHYAEMFYQNTGKYIAEIIKTTPNLKLYDTLNPEYESAAMIEIL